MIYTQHVQPVVGEFRYVYRVTVSKGSGWDQTNRHFVYNTRTEATANHPPHRKGSMPNRWVRIKRVRVVWDGKFWREIGAIVKCSK
jgi:hypothetical protein